MFRVLRARRRIFFFAAFVLGLFGVVEAACVPDYETTVGGDGGPSGDAGHPDGTVGDADAGRPTGDGAFEAGSADAPGGPTPDGGGSVDASVFALSPGPYNGWTCATSKGAFYCWGDQYSTDDGEFGFYADAATFPLPVPAPTQFPVDEVKVGFSSMCYRSGGAVYCRGDNGDGQLGNVPTQNNSASEVPVVGLPAPTSQLAMGLSHGCALLTSADAGFGNVYCWGGFEMGLLTLPPTSSVNTGGSAWPVQIAPPDAGIVSIHDATFVASGDLHTCIIRAGGKVFCWGDSDLHAQGGPLGPGCTYDNNSDYTCQYVPAEVKMPAGETPIALALGGVHSCALMQSGTVYCWGGNYYGQLGAGTPQPTCDIADGGYYKVMGPGISLCSPTPVKVAGLSNKVVQLVSGEEHTCALDDHRTAYCWGTNLYGELGDHQAVPYSVQARMVPNPANLAVPFYFDEIAAGDVKTCGRQGTSWYCWGGGVLGTQLPDGATPDNTIPALVALP